MNAKNEMNVTSFINFLLVRLISTSSFVFLFYSQMADDDEAQEPPTTTTTYAIIVHMAAAKLAKL